MKINDTRGKSKELTFEELEAGKVYISSRLQKYVMFCNLGLSTTGNDYTVCLETGELFNLEEMYGDVFTEVSAVLQIS